MDDWTHPYHGPGGGLASKDKIIKFPLGLRWHDGVPYNLMIRMHNANRWTTTRAMVVSGDRCFSLSSSVSENLGRTYQEMHNTKTGHPQYLTARDAWNGLLLWRVRIGDLYYGGLHLNNRAPMVVGGGRVYTVSENRKLVALDAATGKVVATYDTKYIPGRILLDRGVVVAATWKGGTHIGGVNGIDRRRQEFGIAEGTVEAFDAAGGAKLWSLGKLATFIRSADGNLYMIGRTGADPVEERRRGKDVPNRRPDRQLIALDLRSGKGLWEADSKTMSLGARDHVAVEVAGLGVVTVCVNNGKRTIALRAKDGKILFDVKGNSYAAIYEDKVHVGGTMYDPKTGENVGKGGIVLGSTVCTPKIHVNGITTMNRGCGYNDHGKRVRYEAARGACMFAAIPANGAFYVAQNWCRCAPAQIPGIVSFGPVGRVPTEEEIKKAPAVLKGPAFGKTAGRAGKDDWAMYKGGPSRGSAAASKVPTAIKVEWTCKVAAPAGEGELGTSWRESLTGPLTAPVAAGGIVVVADIHRHQVVALDPATGAENWRRTVGGRINTPPTIYKGLCLFGSYDGNIYAFRVADGKTVWQMRMAPEEARMVSYGQVESTWPVVGSVAGTGVILHAFEPGAVRAKKPRTLWQHAAGEGQITAAVICPNAVVIGGGLYPKDTKVRRGFIRVLSRDKGTVLSEKTFQTPLTFDGIAVAGGKIYATFADGTTVCLAAR